MLAPESVSVPAPVSVNEPRPEMFEAMVVVWPLILSVPPAALSVIARLDPNENDAPSCSVPLLKMMASPDAPRALSVEATYVPPFRYRPPVRLSAKPLVMVSVPPPDLTRALEPLARIAVPMVSVSLP